MSISESLLFIEQIIQSKYIHEEKNNYTERLTHKPYLNGLEEEIQEVKEEVRPNNSVYLEDECADIVWDLMNMFYRLHKEGYIDSTESVFMRCAQKYQERIDAIMAKKLWKEVKENQYQKRLHEAQAKGQRLHEEKKC